MGHHLVAGAPPHARNILGTKKRRGKGASYGVGLALTGLEAGTHTVVLTGAFPSLKYKATEILTLTAR